MELRSHHRSFLDQEQLSGYLGCLEKVIRLVVAIDRRLCEDNCRTVDDEAGLVNTGQSWTILVRTFDYSSVGNGRLDHNYNRLADLHVSVVWAVLPAYVVGAGHLGL